MSRSAFRMDGSLMVVRGDVTVTLTDEHGQVKAQCRTHNLVTAVGDRLYASRGAGLTTSALPVGMKLGTGSTAVAKTGAGAALSTYLANSHQGFDSTFPSESGGIASYKVTYATGKATSASPITEAVIFTDSLADATSTAANTIARVLLSGFPSKGSLDTLTIVWNHPVLGT